MTAVRPVEDRPLRSALRFAVVTLLPILALGWVLDSMVRDTIESRTAQVYGGMTRAMFRMASDAIVQPEDFATGQPLPPERTSMIDYLIAQVGADRDEVKVSIIGRDRHVLYTNQTNVALGETVPASDQIDQALVGETGTRYVRGTINGEGDPEDLIELTIPIEFNDDDRVYGAIVASGIDGSIIASIDRDVRRMQVSLFVAMAALWLILMPIAASMSRSLRRHSAANRHLALHDTLTGLPNRNLLHERLRRALAGRARSGGDVGLLLIDLDRFKDVNDTLGHGTGDRLLQGVSDRLVASVRAQDTVARLGGDEFAVVVSAPDDVQSALAEVARRVTESLREPFLLDGIEVAIEASIGGAVCAEGTCDADQLLQHADIAMYAAKAEVAAYVEYRPELDSHSPRRLAMAADLGKAMASDDQLVVHFQPVASPLDGEIHAMEALVRWNHPTLGLLQPVEFIPMAEQSGMMRTLSAKVLDLSLAQARTWVDAGFDVSVAVNLSASDLRTTTIVDEVVAALAAHGVAPDRLELEVTETAMLASPETAVATISALRSHGVRVALDDFGTGYSSLTYLKQLCPDRLKIDRSFVDAMTHDATDAQIVKSIIDLAHSLRIGVTAEGVETQAHWDLLGTLGCDLVQGYFLARPLEPAAADAWLRERAEASAAAFA